MAFPSSSATTFQALMYGRSRCLATEHQQPQPVKGPSRLQGCGPLRSGKPRVSTGLLVQEPGASWPFTATRKHNQRRDVPTVHLYHAVQEETRWTLQP